MKTCVIWKLSSILYSLKKRIKTIMDERKLILELSSFPPSVNNYWLSNGKYRYLSPRARSFRQYVIDSMPKNWTPFLGRLKLFIELYPSSRRQLDIDNFNKSLMDSLEHAGAYINDSQVDELIVVRKNVIPKTGKVIITLETLDA